MDQQFPGSRRSSVTSIWVATVITIVLWCSVCGVARGDDKNITRLLNNAAVVNKQIMCVLEKSPCDQLGQQLKGVYKYIWIQLHFYKLITIFIICVFHLLLFVLNCIPFHAIINRSIIFKICPTCSCSAGSDFAELPKLLAATSEKCKTANFFSADTFPRRLGDAASQVSGRLMD